MSLSISVYWQIFNFQMENIEKKLPHKQGVWAKNFEPEIIVVHHDGVKIEDWEDPVKRYIADAQYSMKKPYAYGTQYHFMIARNGRVLQGLALNEMTAHCNNDVISRNSVAVCFQGNYEEQDLTLKQREAFLSLLEDLKDKGYKTLTWHQNIYSATQCPGRNIIDFLTNIKFEKSKITIEEAKKIVNLVYRLSLGREAQKEEQETWGEWIIANSVSGFISAVQWSPESKNGDKKFLDYLKIGNKNFYLDEQPNGMRRTIKEVLKDKKII